jgi:hypothetical protein
VLLVVDWSLAEAARDAVRRTRSDSLARLREPRTLATERGSTEECPIPRARAPSAFDLLSRTASTIFCLKEAIEQALIQEAHHGPTSLQGVVRTLLEVIKGLQAVCPACYNPTSA